MELEHYVSIYFNLNVVNSYILVYTFFWLLNVCNISIPIAISIIEVMMCECFCGKECQPISLKSVIRSIFRIGLKGVKILFAAI